MTTSFTRTREQLARMVLRKLNVQNPTDVSADMDLVYEAIDLRIKTMHTDGTFWRKVTNVPVTFSLSSSIATASAGAGDILFPLKVTFTNGDNDDPVRLIGIREYASIPDKTRSGNPECVLWKGGSEFIFHPVPNADGTAKLVYEKLADDTSAGAAPDVEVSMMRWLKDELAYDLGDEFGQTEQKMQRLMRESMVADKMIKKLSVQRVDTVPVAVDDFERSYRHETDYDRGDF
jgi:hypothetical protein